MDQYLYKPNNVPVYQKLFQVSVVNLNWNVHVIYREGGGGDLVLNSAHHSKRSSDKVLSL